MSELYWRNTVSTLMRDILLFHVIGSLVLILLRFTIIIHQPAGNPNFPQRTFASTHGGMTSC
jgi:hypothetical protein